MGYLGGFKFLRFFMYIYFPTQILLFFLLRNKKVPKGLLIHRSEASCRSVAKEKAL